jgi:hypothetical protein
MSKLSKHLALSLATPSATPSATPWAATLAIWVLASTALTAHAACPSWPTAERFVQSGAEVTDQRTGLTWQRCSAGQSWSGSTCTGTATGHTHEAALALAKAANPSQTANGWRLPNVKELASLADKGCQSPAIDSTAFPATPSNWFWSSSPYVGDSSNAWVVSFDNGYVNSNARGGSGHVRLVRASQ